MSFSELMISLKISPPDWFCFFYYVIAERRENVNQKIECFPKIGKTKGVKQLEIGKVAGIDIRKFYAKIEL